MSSLRNKQGTLELYKSKKWKCYIFKVTGNTYLHYFNDTKMNEAKEQIFLTTVKSVDVPLKLPKDGRYVFEVKHAGKTSPWILNASSEVERNEWMEAILPGSTIGLSHKKVSKVTSLRHSQPVTTPTVTPTSSLPPTVTAPIAHPTTSNRSMISESISLTPLTSITESRHTRTPSLDGMIAPPIVPRPVIMPRPSQMDFSHSSTPAEYLDPVQLNMPPASPKLTSRPASNGSLNGFLDVDDRVSKTTEETCPISHQAYLRLQSRTDNTSNEQQILMDKLQTHFTSSQMGMLLGMLKQLQMSNRETTPTTATDSLTDRPLSYLFTKTADTLTESILVTEDDDPDSYDKRPQWAKAIYADSKLNAASSVLVDVETNHIFCEELSDLVEIGSGQFGKVYSANYTPKEYSNGDSVKVAVKTSKSGLSEQQKKDMLREIAVMSNLMHPNIVKFYGIFEKNDIPSIVLEFLPYGDLKSYLAKSGKKSMETLVKYMVDVAMGMHYIAERGLVHRDLAARNVLVGEGELCKVADFGMLRELPQDDSIYISCSNIPCPIRWMPPEAISKRSFSVASDVWSYGILQWEMFNPTKLPYHNMDNFQVVSKINSGYRMPTPRGCPSVVSRIMKACWHVDPAKRPSFLVITSLLTTRTSFVTPPTVTPPTTVTPSTTTDIYY